MNQLGLRIAESVNSMAPQEAPPPGTTIDLARLAAAVRRRRQVIAAPVAVLIGLGLVYLATTPRSYMAASAVLLDAEVNPAVAEIASLDGRRFTEAAIENARLVIQSDAVAAAVAARLTEDQVQSLLDPPRSLFGRLIGAAVGLVRLPIDLLRPDPPAAPAAAQAPVPAPGGDAAAAAEAARHALVGRTLRQGLQVQRIGRSAAVSVSYASHDPVLAAAVANGFAQAYLDDVFEANAQSSTRAAAWLEGRLASAAAAAQAAAAEAEAFRAEKGLVSADGVFMAEDSVRRLNVDLAAAQTEAARARALVSAYEAAVARGPEALKAGVPVRAAGEPDPEVEALQTALAGAVAALARISETYGAEHPQAVRLAEEADAAAGRLALALAQRLERARGDLSVAEARVAALRESIAGALGESAESGAAQVELRALEQRAATLGALYQSLLSRAEEIGQQSTLPVSPVRILSLSEVPRAAQGPRASRVLGAALLIGLMIGTVLAALKERRARGLLHTGEDVRDVAQREFLGYVPEVEAPGPSARGDGAASGPPPAFVPGAVFGSVRRRADGPSASPEPSRLGGSGISPLYGDAIQGVRLALDLRPGGAGGRAAIGITSLNPGEGKTTLVRDLATVLAQAGATVLLVDAHPRSPALSRAIGATTGPGLAEAVSGAVPWTEAVRRSAQPGLSVLPCLAGTSPARAAKVLGSRGFRALVDAAREDYDQVLIDLPPLSPFVEARAPVRALGRVVIVARCGRTSGVALRAALDADPVLSERVAGVVLNRASPELLEPWREAPSAAAWLDACRAAAA
jgi:succinoglycan biosynthesis transport protein ExoP